MIVRGKAMRQMRLQRSALALALVVPVLGAAAWPSYAESALEFFLNEARRHAPIREPEATRFLAPPFARVTLQRSDAQPRRSFARRVVPPESREDALEAREGVRSGRSSNEFERVVCVRVCDGARFAMAIQPKGEDRRSAETMCRAAGGGAATRLVAEALGSNPEVLVASAGGPMVQDGRAALAPVAAPPAKGKACPAPEEGQAFQVPIMADATLVPGDIVATDQGFKRFVGGRPPHSQRDFVSVQTPRELAAAEPVEKRRNSRR